MATHEIRLKDRREVAEGTMAFYFEKPPGFQFTAGQFVSLTLTDPPETDAEGNRRTFSLASAPDEEDLMIATRMRDTAFKRVLKTIALGTALRLQGPFGSLTLHSNPEQPAVFLTGGIGITPFRSIVCQANHSRLAHRLFLFYSNRRPEDAAFLEELQEGEKSNPNYKLVATMTQMAKSSRQWQGETGAINPEMLARYISDLGVPKYYVAGPPGMVDAMQKTLTDAKVAADDIRAEQFAGYD